MRILNYTGFKTVTEYFMNTTFLDRAFFNTAVPEYEREKLKQQSKVMGLG